MGPSGPGLLEPLQEPCRYGAMGFASRSVSVGLARRREGKPYGMCQWRPCGGKGGGKGYGKIKQHRASALLSNPKSSAKTKSVADSALALSVAMKKSQPTALGDYSGGRFHWVLSERVSAADGIAVAGAADADDWLPRSGGRAADRERRCVKAQRKETVARAIGVPTNLRSSF